MSRPLASSHSSFEFLPEHRSAASSVQQTRGGRHAAVRRMQQGLPKGNEGILVELTGQAARAWGLSLKSDADLLNSEVFDLTERHTAHIFDTLTSNGQMSISLFRRALEIEGFNISVDEDPTGDLLERIFEALKIPDAIYLGKLSFQAGLQLLKLQVLYIDMELTRSNKFRRMDWSPWELSDRYFHPLVATDLREHLISERELNRLPTRWIHFEAPGPSDILRAAIEYNLHPLAVEDALKLPRQSAPRIRKYGDYHLIILPIVRLTEAAKMMLAEYHRQPDVDDRKAINIRVAVELECARLCLFTRAAPFRDTVLSIVSAWQPYTVVQRTQTRESRGTCSEDKKALSNMSETITGRAVTAHIFNKVAKSLLKDYSESRLADASQLTWLLMSNVLDQYKEVYDAYASRLSWCEYHYHTVRLDVDLMRLHADLTHLVRDLRPLVPLVNAHQKELDIEDDQQVYMDEVCDDILRMVGDIDRAMDLCNSIREEIMAEKVARKNDTLFKLFLLASIILPWQFLTGLYSMNFVSDAGKPVLPLIGEMSLARSYVMFWGLGVLITSLVMLWWRQF